MPFELKIAFRYFRTRRRSLARFTTAVAIAGIAAGAASLIIANALAKGFADEMRNKILGNTAHIAVSMKDGGEIFNWKEIAEKLKNIENVETVSPTVFTNSIIIGETAVSYAVLVVEFGKPETGNGTIKISPGARLAEKIGAKTGGEVELVTLEDQTEPKRSKVSVGEIFSTGLFEYDATRIKIAPADFASLNGKTEFTPAILSVSVSDIYKTNETAREIGEILGEDFQILDWQEANRPLFAALSLERKVSLAIISLIIFIAALNITTTLTLLVNERRFDIAILRTCGAKTRSLVLIFLLEGLFIGLSGVLLGTALGLLGCFLGNYFRIVSISAEVYSLSYIPFHINFPGVLLIMFFTLAVCLTATVFPALKASRIKPLDNLNRN